MYVKSDCSFLFNRWKVGHSDPCLSHVQSRGGGEEGAIDPAAKEVRDRLFRTAIIILKSFPSPSCREMELLNCFDVFGGLLCPLLRRHLHFVILASFVPDLSAD